MSDSDALLNLIISFIVLTPMMVLSWLIIRKTPVDGLSGAEKWRAYRIRIGAWGMILLGVGLMLYFALNLIV